MNIILEKLTKQKKITSGSNLTEDIKALKQLYDDGVLTKEEFEKAKKETVKLVKKLLGIVGSGFVEILSYRLWDNQSKTRA